MCGGRRGAGRRLLEERHGAAELMREGSGCEGALFRSKFARWHRLREANPALYEGAAAHQAMRDRAWRDGGALDPEAEVAAMRRECDRARLRWQRQLGGGADDVDPTTPARGRRGVERTTSEEGEAPARRRRRRWWRRARRRVSTSTKGARCSTFGS